MQNNITISEPNKPYIYLIRNKLNNMIYIGASAGNKKKTYWSSSKYVKNDIKKYGIENFEKIILNTFDTMEDAYAAESRLVDEKFVAQQYTYNKMPAKFQKGFTSQTGSYAGKTAQDNLSLNEERAFEIRSNAGKIGGKKNKDKQKSEQHKENLSKIRKDKNDWLTDEWRNNLGLSFKSRWEKLKLDINYVNHIKGRKWINKNGESKMVNLNELHDYLNDGWSYGRKV